MTSRIRDLARFPAVGKLTVVGIALGTAFWLADSAIVALAFGEGTLLAQLLSPGPREIWIGALFSFCCPS